ncbi:MAG TPA: hypothetical protein VJU59_24415 [Paraburkholderia sp.]|nr:hypothetical protein [Paraburkholderia sp.]
MTSPRNAVPYPAEPGYTPAAADHPGRGRPDYPPEVNASLPTHPAFASGATVVDLGTDTRKFTRNRATRSRYLRRDRSVTPAR